MHRSRESQPNSEIVVLDSQGQVARRIDGGARVENNYAANTSAMRIWAADVDGDGKDEFVYVTDDKIRAARGSHDEPLWEWPLPDRAGGIREIRGGGAGRAGVVIVEAANTDQFDEWGMNHLNSFPPLEGIGKRGDSIFALDGRTGQPIWRGLRNAINIATVVPAESHTIRSPGVPLIDSANSPRVISRPNMQWTVSRTSMPTDVNGRFAAQTRSVREGNESHAATGRVDQSNARDPRLLRRLPWMTPAGKADAISFFQPPLFIAAYSLAVLVIPATILYFAVGRFVLWVDSRRMDP